MSEQSYDYLIIGAGVAGGAAAAGIRAVDQKGTIALVGAESDPPAYRPMLSKDLWLKEDKSIDDVWTLDAERVDLHTDTTISGLDVAKHQATTSDGSTLTYGKAVIATGGSPRHLDGLPEGDRVIYFRTAADYRKLRELAKSDCHVVVVGGGYIGSEIAAALAQNRVKVTMLFPEDVVQERMFPRSLAERITKAFTDHGVEVRHGTQVAKIDPSDTGVTVHLDGGEQLTADAAVVGAGLIPGVDLAKGAGINTDDGIIVDQQLRTSAQDVYAAGDVAQYPDALLGVRRVEHVDNAEKMGERAGRNAAGEDLAYEYTPLFWSDLFDYGYEAVGVLDSKLDVVEDWNDAGDAGVVYYLDGGAVRGVLLWNVWGHGDDAREVIRATAAGELGKGDLLGRIPLG